MSHNGNKDMSGKHHEQSYGHRLHHPAADFGSSAGPAATGLPALPHYSNHYHHIRPRIIHGHRRAKSAGNASSVRDYSYYEATGLYAHQSGDNLDKNAPIIALTVPALKKTSSENTLHYDATYPPFYFPLHHHHLDPNISVKYPSLKIRTVERDTNNLDVEKIECGCWSLKFDSLRKFATIQFFVFLCCLLVTLQQALSSGYFNR